MKRLLNILLILISTLGYSQSNPELDVFKKVINYEIEKGNSGIYLQCEKSKTFFNAKDFKEQTLLQVPLNILKELEQKAENSNEGRWSSDLLTDLKYGSDFIKTKTCLSKKDSENLFESTGARQSIISISEAIFDENYENCVISVTYGKFRGSAYGHSYFLKKVYGVWTVVTTYNHWMT